MNPHRHKMIYTKHIKVHHAKVRILETFITLFCPCHICSDYESIQHLANEETAKFCRVIILGASADLFKVTSLEFL